jgi:predicted NBD/HSP70 family sugar kinase
MGLCNRRGLSRNCRAREIVSWRGGCWERLSLEQFFRKNHPIAGLGVASFGPTDVRRASPTWGQITTAPKVGWAHTNLVGTLAAALEEATFAGTFRSG